MELQMYCVVCINEHWDDNYDWQIDHSRSKPMYTVLYQRGYTHVSAAGTRNYRCAGERRSAVFTVTGTIGYCTEANAQRQSNNQVRRVVKEGMLLVWSTQCNFNVNWKAARAGKKTQRRTHEIQKRAEASAHGSDTKGNRRRTAVTTIFTAYLIFLSRQKNTPMLCQIVGFGRMDRCTPHQCKQHMLIDCDLEMTRWRAKAVVRELEMPLKNVLMASGAPLRYILLGRIISKVVEGGRGNQASKDKDSQPCS
jgi:hypothetical protein